MMSWDIVSRPGFSMRIGSKGRRYLRNEVIFNAIQCACTLHLVRPGGLNTPKLRTSVCRGMRHKGGLARRARGFVGHLEAGAVGGTPPAWPAAPRRARPPALLEESQSDLESPLLRDFCGVNHLSPFYITKTDLSIPSFQECKHCRCILGRIRGL